ncbi:MAG: bifunctional diguanylate cyclase/phosphodiesterase [Pontibacterium sp.]
MRSFRAKLLLPLILLLLSMGAFMELYWFPSWQQQAVEDRMSLETSYLNLVGAVLRGPVRTGDTAAVYEVLDQLVFEKEYWEHLRLIHADGTLLYPQDKPDMSGADDYQVSSDIVFNGQKLAGLQVSLELSHFLKEERDRLRLLEVVMLVVVLFAVMLVGWVQKQLVLHPIDKLAGTARQIAKGDFYSPIPVREQAGGLGEFFNAFVVMRDSIAEKHVELNLQIEEREIAERRLNDSQRIALLGCWEWNPGAGVFWCSDSLLPIMHLDSQQILDVNVFFSHVYPADAVAVKRAFTDMADDGVVFDAEFRVNTADGVKYVHIIGQRDQQTLRSFGTCQDVTDRKEIESSLRKLSSAITYSGSSVMITDIVGTIEYVNPQYTQATGYPLISLLGQQPEILSRQWMSAEKYEILWRSILDGQHWRGELQSLREDGSMYWSLVSISPIKNEFAELTHFVIVLEDVSELKDAHAKMEQLALYDELTGLANRRFFYSKLKAQLEQTDPLQIAAVMLLDLDFFKTINDTRGHRIGDELLKAVAGRLNLALQGSGVAARLGGDEFALLVCRDDETGVKQVAESVLSGLSRPFMIDDLELQVTTSLGVALIPKDGDEPDSLLKHADLAMYQAKEMGRNQFRFFTDALHEQLQTYIRFTREMPQALENGEFLLHFQPQVDLETGNIIGAEALLRWQHPELGMVPPTAFIPVAEETGFIVQLGHWVVKKGCEALRQLKISGFAELTLAINISARQFRDPLLISMISQEIQNAGIDAKHLEIEITETLLMHDIDRAINTLTELQALGMSIAIDDFGIGYSSFNYLKTLPINVLKVDREFIKDIPDHQDDMEITAAIISMAHRLNLKVVAEGIETHIQQVFLEEHDCDYGQGYLFSRPVPLDSFITLLASPVSQHLYTDITG